MPARAAHRGWCAARAAAGAGVLLLAACASAPPETPKLAWPPPPDPPRIQFVRSIASDKAIDKDASFEEKALEFLTGKQAPANHIDEPMAIAVSDDGNRLYVSDFSQFAVFIFDFQNKVFSKIGKDEPLQRPFGIGLDDDENLYVVEQMKKGVSVFNRKGEPLRFITDPSIERPGGLAIDRKRKRLYVADTSRTKSGHHDVKIFDLQGALIGTLGKGKGSGEGYFLFPTYVSVDAAGNVYVTDTLNSRVQEFDPDGKYITHFGDRGTGWGMFDKPKGVATDRFGNVYVVDSGWSNVQIFNQKGQILLFFGGRGNYAGLMQNPTGITIDARNRIYVADYLNHRIEVYQLINTSSEDSLAKPVDLKGAGPPPEGSAYPSAPAPGPTPVPAPAPAADKEAAPR